MGEVFSQQQDKSHLSSWVLSSIQNTTIGFSRLKEPLSKKQKTESRKNILVLWF